MSFTEDPTVFFDIDGFAVTANYDSGTTIKGILDDGYVEVQGVEATRPMFTCAASDVSGVVHGKSLVVGGTTYSVVGVQPDQTGDFTTLVLSE